MALSTQALIDQAFKQRQLFYKPWVGIKYDEGIRLSQSKPIKVLVIGASRYCEYSNLREKNNQPLCHHLSDCVGRWDYDELMRIATECPFVNDSEARGNTHTQYCLYDINTASILRSFYDSDLPTAYSTFQKVLNKRARFERPEEIWKHIAFFNYCQPIIWGEEKGKRTQTPRWDYTLSVFADSRPIVELLISLLSPDLVFLWQSRPLKDGFDLLFPLAKPLDYTIRPSYKNGKSKTYLTYSLPVGEKVIQLFPAPQ